MTLSIGQYRVIVITDHDYIGTGQRVLKLGAADYIPKPFNVSLITLTVERILEAKRIS